MTEPAAPWERAMRALALLAIDPAGLGGLTLRARSGPVRHAFETALRRVPGDTRRIHPDLSDTQLFGGADIAATLAAGQLVRQGGIADSPAMLILPMAERTPPQLAARLSQMLDGAHGHSLILLDEGVDDDETAPACLLERLAFHIDLNALGWREASTSLPDADALQAARARLGDVSAAPEDLLTLVNLAARFGIDSLRAPLLALHAARALAAFDARGAVSADDLRAATELVYPHRATVLPQQEDDPAPELPEAEPEDDTCDTEMTEPPLPDEMLIAAVAALLPPDLLDRLRMSAAQRRGMRGSGAGARRKGNRRGRPLPSRPGHPDGRARIDIVATLRNAAPWQAVRKRQRPGAAGLIIHPADIRLRRFEERSDRLLIFAVDASGSSAMARLAEAKGAVELLLAQAYARRDQVALIAFRGIGAELLLPPTRSLVQAKRRLAALPGGGGTPLAAALMAAATLADQSRGRGLSPTLALLTDGRANVALDGQGGRVLGRQDADQMARHLRLLGLPVILIDTAARPGRESAQLADHLGAQYLPLPRADAERISVAVNTALEN